MLDAESCHATRPKFVIGRLHLEVAPYVAKLRAMQCNASYCLPAGSPIPVMMSDSHHQDVAAILVAMDIARYSYSEILYTSCLIHSPQLYPVVGAYN